jgi:uncharacterized membrane protein
LIALLIALLIFFDSLAMFSASSITAFRTSAESSPQIPALLTTAQSAEVVPVPFSFPVSEPLPEEMRKDRFYILDLVRLVAMLLMMQGHTLDALISAQYMTIAEFPWNVWNFVRGLTAPTFLLISGAVQIFATKRDANGIIPMAVVWKRVRWGLMLIALGYLLVFPANRVFDLPFVPPEKWRLFFQANILHLSGVTLIAVIVLMRCTRTTRGFAVASTAIAVVITLFAPLSDRIQWFDCVPEFLGAYFSFKHGSLFVIFPFAAYMFAGVGVGAVLAELRPEERIRQFPRLVIPTGILLLSIGIIGTYVPFSFYPPHDYFLSSSHFVCIRLGCVLVLIGALTYFYTYTRQFEEYYARLGKKSLYIYVAHLIVLFGLPWFGGIARSGYYRSLSILEGVVVAFGVVSFTLISAYILDYYQRRSRFVWRGIVAVLVLSTMYALLV